MHDKFVDLPCKKRRIYWEQIGENANVLKTYLIDNQWTLFLIGTTTAVIGTQEMALLTFRRF